MVEGLTASQQETGNENSTDNAEVLEQKDHNKKEKKGDGKEKKGDVSLLLWDFLKIL